MLSVWNRSAADYNCTTRIRDTLRRVLNLPPNTPMEYKSHCDSLKYLKTTVPPNTTGTISPATSTSAPVGNTIVSTSSSNISSSNNNNNIVSSGTTSTNSNSSVYTPPSARGGGASGGTGPTSRFFSRPSFTTTSHS